MELEVSPVMLCENIFTDCREPRVEDFGSFGPVKTPYSWKRLGKPEKIVLKTTDDLTQSICREGGARHDLTAKEFMHHITCVLHVLRSLGSEFYIQSL